jgi:hypothetical protein
MVPAAVAPATPAQAPVSLTCHSAWRLQMIAPVLRAAIARGLPAALLAPAACFYTTTINERPHAEITVASGPHYPGESVSLTAPGSGDSEDGAEVDCTWRAETCLDPTCSTTQPTPDNQPTTRPCADQHPLKVPPQDHRSIRVILIVQDQQGGMYTDRQIIEIGNREPDVRVQVRSAGTATHSVVSLPVEASVSVDDPDEDPVVLTWRLLKPRGGGAVVTLVKDDDETNDKVRFFTPDAPGLWSVEVIGEDGIDSASETAAIDVEEDGPPCIALTSPAATQAGRLVLRRDEGPRVFAALQVTDDLDPLPRPPGAPPFVGEPAFTWQLASPDTGGTLVPVAGALGPDLTIDPSAYAPGDLIDLRLEVSDRIARELPCDEAAPTCALGGDECHQRLSWGVEIR